MTLAPGVAVRSTFTLEGLESIRSGLTFVPVDRCIGGVMGSWGHGVIDGMKFDILTRVLRPKIGTDQY